MKNSLTTIVTGLSYILVVMLMAACGQNQASSERTNPKSPASTASASDIAESTDGVRSVENTEVVAFSLFAKTISGSSPGTTKAEAGKIASNNFNKALVDYYKLCKWNKMVAVEVGEMTAVFREYGLQRNGKPFHWASYSRPYECQRPTYTAGGLKKQQQLGLLEPVIVPDPSIADLAELEALLQEPVIVPDPSIAALAELEDLLQEAVIVPDSSSADLAE